MRDICCMKDWIFNKEVLFKEGEVYPVIDVNCSPNGTLGVRLKTDNDILVWFWEESEYFDVFSYFR